MKEMVTTGFMTMCSTVVRSQELAAKTLSFAVAIFGNHSVNHLNCLMKNGNYIFRIFIQEIVKKKCRNNRVVVRDNREDMEST